MRTLIKQLGPIVAVLVVCGALIAGLTWFFGPGSAERVPELKSDATTELPGPLSPEALAEYDPAMVNDNNPRAIITTNRGDIELELFAETMPITTGNFIDLAESDFYAGTKFHRVIEGFMIQGGDPITKTDEFMRYGRGDPGYTIPDEHVAGEHLTNLRGTIAMANSGPESGGSQFFINLVDNTHLDFDKPPTASKHPVFGKVISGMDVVDAIGATETGANDLPTEDVIVESVEIIRPAGNSTEGEAAPEEE